MFGSESVPAVEIPALCFSLIFPKDIHHVLYALVYHATWTIVLQVVQDNPAHFLNGIGVFLLSVFSDRNLNLILIPSAFLFLN